MARKRKRYVYRPPTREEIIRLATSSKANLPRPLIRPHGADPRAYSGLGARGGGSAFFNVHVTLETDVGASSAHAISALACITKTGRARRSRAAMAKRGSYFDTRCGQGTGSSPTRAAKKALADLARKLKR
jgi:hypothetical protein